MEIKGEYRIAASREKVFAALNDQAILQACIPGCESLEMLSPTEMTAKVRLRIGPVSASRFPTSIRRTATGSPAKGRAASRASPRAALSWPSPRMAATRS
jgi:carbon monoxide dehydrogenase subunit G